VRRLVNEYSIQSSASAKFPIAQDANMEHVTAEVLCVPVGAFTKAQLTSTFLELLQSKKHGWISYANVHMIDISNQLPWYKQFIMDAIFRYYDGEGASVLAHIC